MLIFCLFILSIFNHINHVICDHDHGVTDGRSITASRDAISSDPSCSSDDGNFKCGDICTHKSYSCTCGNITFGYRNTQHQCCVPAGHQCTHNGYDNDGNAKYPVCHTGQACTGTCPPGNITSGQTEYGNFSCGFPEQYKDDCDYRGQHRCGDLCIDWRDNCECGNQVFSIVYGDQHCCVPPSTRAQCYKNEFGHAVCPYGTPLSRSQQCNGKCYAEYSQGANTSALSTRSRFRCDNGQCVRLRFMCRGYALCEDKSDLRACNPELTCVYKGRHVVSNVSTINSDLVKGHSFCTQSSTRNNGEYAYITREDEDNLDIVSNNAVSMDYSKLSYCNTSEGPGVICGSRCAPNFWWCKKTTANHCNNQNQSFTTKDPHLCRNSTFWNEVSCVQNDKSGAIVAHGKRCSGAMQHCYYPWYVNSNKHYEADFL